MTVAGSPSLLRRAGRRLRRLLLWFDPFRYVLGTLRQSIAAQLAGMALPRSPRVLDYGCGGQPYRSLLPDGCEYVGADIAGNERAQIVINADGTLPVAEASYDLVLSTQVLEHVDDPSVYLEECRRILRPGGRLLLTTHGLMFYHPYPQDLWRWTADGLRLAVQRAGLQVVGVEGVVGLIPASVWLVMFEYQACLPWGLRHLFVLSCNLLMLLSDRMTSDGSRLRNACVYNLVAQRGAD
ncbi:MAG TPA: class I SAM-dependent methyltransferase [Nevskiales bacterium]|nr:class I SAM-dependent methyltransferase [Nevskiales bacterium]